MTGQSPASKALLAETARNLRSAIDERDRIMTEHIAAYDAAVESLDEWTVDTAGLKLILFATMLDPVRAVMERYGQMAKLLERTEARL